MSDELGAVQDEEISKYNGLPSRYLRRSAMGLAQFRTMRIMDGKDIGDSRRACKELLALGVPVRTIMVSISNNASEDQKGQGVPSHCAVDKMSVEKELSVGPHCSQLHHTIMVMVMTLAKYDVSTIYDTQL